MTANVKGFPKSPAVREVNTVHIADPLDFLAMKADAIALAVHGVMEIASCRLAEPVAVLADELRADLNELSSEVHASKAVAS